MQCSVSSDYGTSILNSSEININEHNNITITITSYYGLLFVVLLNKTVVCYSPFTYWGQPELLSAAQNISNTRFLFYKNTFYKNNQAQIWKK